MLSLKTLSGTLGKNLIDIEFSNQQVIDSDEHKLLMNLKNSELKDDETVSEIYKHIIQSIDFEGKYLILLICDKYDVPVCKGRRKVEDTSGGVTYILLQYMSCKTKTKPALLVIMSMKTVLILQQIGL